jgi:cytochrome c oxidase cbb3-type subunit 4
VSSYDTLRGFADSWGLALMFLVFVVILVWVLRPGARKQQDDASKLIFRNEDRPKNAKDDADGR